MIFKRFYDEQLAQASYLIGCAASGGSVVIDPNRNVDQYIAAAESEGLTISAVTETHIHADFVSGVRELSARTGARMYLSDAGPPDWKYGFRTDPNVQLLHDRDEFPIGNIRLRAVHTPGHTPEHLSFLVTDTAAASVPMGVCTGDFVFVGDVGRPDLLEKAAHVADASDGSARELWHSLQAFKGQADFLQIWPGHGAGSACGKGLSAVPQSTLGYERRFNWAFGVESEDEFVRQVLSGQPEPPRYFGIMKRINRDGPRLLEATLLPERIAESQVAGLLASGATLLDLRPAAEFAGAHIPGTINIPLTKSFTTWAGSLVSYDADVFLLTGTLPSESVAAVVRQLALIGLDRVRGYVGGGALELWETTGQRLGTVPQIGVEELSADQRDRVVIDVRGASEWELGHMPGAYLIPLAELPERIAEVPTQKDVVVHCQGGGRSSIAASILLAHGYDRVSNLSGGFQAWARATKPVSRE